MTRVAHGCGGAQVEPGVWRDGATGLEYRVVSNDGSRQHLMWLIGVKNIFSQQLPKMPKEYIVRLVLDRCVCLCVCVCVGLLLVWQR